MKRRIILAAPLVLGGCVSVGLGGDAAPQSAFALRDAGLPATELRPQPLVDALVLQASPSDALADGSAMAYSPRDGEFRTYQLASWTERPVRAVPRLLQARLERRGVAAAVGMLGDPLRADWLLAVSVDAAHHDLRSEPGRAYVAMTLELYDRRLRHRVSRRRFEAAEAAREANAAAFAEALGVALGRAFDEVLPWVEQSLQRAAAVPADAR